MRARFIPIACGLVVGLSVCLGPAAVASAQSAKTRYESALSREPEVRRLIASTRPDAGSAARATVLRRTRQLISAYHALARRYPRSGYTDNALFQAASLHEALFERYARDADRKAALQYYRRVVSEYPSSSLVKKTRATVSQLSSTRSARASTPRLPPPAKAEETPQPATESPAPEANEPSESPPPVVQETPSRPAPSTPATLGRATLTDVQRTVLPEAVRVVLAFDREVPYNEERIDGPPRVFFDLANVSSRPGLVDAVLEYPDDVVRQIRLGRHPDSTVRVVMDFEGVTRHSVFTLYNPFRIVIDFERPSAVRAASAAASAEPPAAPVVRASVEEEGPLRLAKETDLPGAVPAVEEKAPPPVPARETAIVPSAPPAPPSANSAGGFSLPRQLGLGVSRIVIDPGHGGRDPGTRGRGLTEAALTLDVALRLEKLLRKERGLEVVLTRRSNVYVPLEERTEIANREGADLFLSIHANASRNTKAGGIETYYLSFASSPEAEAVAARENAAADSAMHNLPDIIKAIALNSKLDESRDFASMVQESLIARARPGHRDLQNRGVKKAPFVVLIGAEMPSVLAEISFLTNAREAQLLRTAAYKDRIASALHTAVMRYRQALKGQGKIAEQN